MAADEHREGGSAVVGAQHRLATYGTLAPGRPNHHQLDALDGHWLEGHVYGRLIEAGWGASLGYPALILDPDGSAISVQVFESMALPDHWSRLDEFEGPGYQRVVTDVSTPAGDIKASIYVMRGEPVVVFDVGEVLVTPGELFAELARHAGTDVQTLTSAYWAHRGPFDLGGGADSYWRAVLEGAGITHDADLALRLEEFDATSWTTLRPDARSMLEHLNASGVRVAILSNAPLGMASKARTGDWAHLVNDWFFSSELNMAKPDPGIYEAVVAKLGVEPSAVVFFDDRQVNVEAARAAGWRAELWTSAEVVQKTLRDLGLIS
jgi:putative hydrolase of the HAD superfamily